MATLPADVIAEILSRLPVKVLLRFRCVSKSWRSLIDGPDFVNLHLDHSFRTNTNQTIILKDIDIFTVDFAYSPDEPASARVLDHPLMSYNHTIKLLGSCHGLLCISNIIDDMALWNPSTRKYRVIPSLSLERNRYLGKSSCNIAAFGFGFDAISDDYKLVRIVHFEGIDIQFLETEVMVYSLSTNSWRRIQDMPYTVEYPGASGVFVNGALHWMVSRKFDETSEEIIIVALDLGAEEYREVTQPKIVDRKFHVDVAVLGGCLCMVASHFAVCIDAWVMKEYGVKESWTRLFSFKDEEMPRPLRNVKPLVYSKSGNEVLVEHDNTDLFWFDLKDKRVKNVYVLSAPTSFEAEVCLQSLVSLKLNRGNRRQKGGEEKNAKKRDDFLSEGFKLVL